MKIVIKNKALRFINFSLIPDILPSSKRTFNRSKSYVRMIYKKEKRYTLEDNKTKIVTFPDDLYFWPYKNLAIGTKDFCLEIV